MIFLFPRWDMLIPWRVNTWISRNQQDQLSPFPKSHTIRQRKWSGEIWALCHLDGGPHHKNRKLPWENEKPKDWQVAFVPWWCFGFQTYFFRGISQVMKRQTLLKRRNNTLSYFFCRLSCRSMRFTNPRHPGPPGELWMNPHSHLLRKVLRLPNTDHPSSPGMTGGFWMSR